MFRQPGHVGPYRLLPTAMERLGRREPRNSEWTGILVQFGVTGG